MKFFHISDLHLGKRLAEYPLIEDQRYILYKILENIKNEKPDGVLIAGDVYDKGIPPVEAVELFDEFLNKLSELKQKVFIIAGNHDSAERMCCGSKLMESSGVYFSRVYDGKISCFTLEDEYGPVNVYLLPFIKPAYVKAVFPEEAEAVDSYTKAVEVALKHAEIDEMQRNILIAHQFVTGSQRSDSEEINVGGLDNVDAEVFKAFDYVALGHIHGPQNAGGENIRYCGTPLKYSFSEAGQKKSITVVELGKKNVKGQCEIKIDVIPLIPMRDLRELRGSYEELTLKKNYENTNTKDFIHITLTDEEDIPEGFGKLQLIYENLVRLDYDNKRTKNNQELEEELEIDNLSPLDLFGKFYELQNNVQMSDEQKNMVQNLMENILGGEK